MRSKTAIWIVAALSTITTLQVRGAADAPTNAEAKPVAKLSDLFADPVIVRGKGLEVKRSQVDDAFTAYAANLAAHGQNLTDENRPMREAQLLDRLIITQLLLIRSTSVDTNRAMELSKKFIAEAHRAANSEEMFRRQLKAAGMSQEIFANRVMEQALAEAVIERELRPKVNITEAQVEEFYKTGADWLVKEMEAGIQKMGNNPGTTIGELADARKRVEDIKRLNLAKLEQPEKVRVSHILIATRDKQTDEELTAEQKKQKRQLAEKVLVRARSGEDFSKLMKEFSDDKSSPDSGNYVFARNDPFVPEFKSAAFSLSTNQISDLVTSVYGYHIIKLLEHMPAKKLDFAKVSPEIKEALAQQVLQSKMPDYFAEVKKAAAIEILDPKYKLKMPKTTESLRPPS